MTPLVFVVLIQVFDVIAPFTWFPRPSLTGWSFSSGPHVCERAFIQYSVRQVVNHATFNQDKFFNSFTALARLILTFRQLASKLCICVVCRPNLSLKLFKKSFNLTSKCNSWFRHVFHRAVHVSFVQFFRTYACNGCWLASISKGFPVIITYKVIGSSEDSQ